MNEPLKASSKKVKQAIIIILMILSATLLAPTTSVLAQTPSISANATMCLANSYNPTLHLLPETNTSQTYWLVSDNLLASYALRNYNQTMSNQIENTLKTSATRYHLPANSKGLPISYRHEALIGDVLPGAFRNSSQVSYSLFNGTNCSIVTEIDNYTQMNDWASYADLLALRGISDFNSGNISGATDCYNQMLKIWDGSGFADKAYLSSGTYSTYKLGLALIISNDLNIQNASRDNRMASIIGACQLDNGGVRTDYEALNGTIVPSGSANTETTAIIALANVKDNYSPQNSNLTIEIPIVAAIVACVAVVAVYFRVKPHFENKIVDNKTLKSPTQIWL